MHYYKKNIGDYHKKAGRLSMIEHGAYTLLMDACYDREKFPTEREAIDWCWARTEEEIAAVRFVLSKFFVEDGGVYSQNRIAEEVESYRQNAEKNREIALAREAKKRQSTKRARSVQDRTPNQEPITNNQEPDILGQKRKRFVPPTIEQVYEYMQEKGFDNEPQAIKFVNYHTAGGWMAGKNKMKDWKAAVRLWMQNHTEWNK